MSHDFRSVRVDEADLWRRRTYALAALTPTELLRGGSVEVNAMPGGPPMDCEIPGADWNDCVFY